MGIKISKVRDIKSLKQITIKDCEKGYQGEYVCITDNCDANMSFVASCERRLSDKIITVSSYFKLKKGNEHSYQCCPFNTIGAVDVIARDSSCDELKAIKAGKYEFSLQILHNSSKKIKALETSITSDSPENETHQPTKNYQKNGVASNYIKALKQILKLRSMVEKNADLASIIKLTYQTNTIKWNDFYFEEDKYSHAKNTIKKSDPNYPICFYGTISNLSEKTEGFSYNKIKLNTSYVKPKEGINEILSIEIIIADENVNFDDFIIKQEILVYGKLIVNDKKEPVVSKNNPKILFKYINMSIWVNHQAQLVIL